MYISKIVFTEEDKRQILDLQQEFDKKAAALNEAHKTKANDETYRKAFDEYNRIARKLFDINENIRLRYIQELSRDKEKALSNAAEIITTYTKEDYRKDAAEVRKWTQEKLDALERTFEQFPEYRDIPELKSEYNEYQSMLSYTGYNYKSAVARLNGITHNEREALKLGGHGTEELDKLIREHATTFYKPVTRQTKVTLQDIFPPVGKDANYMLQAFAEQSPFFSPLLNGPVTNALSTISTKPKNVKVNRSDEATATKNGITIMIEDYSSLSVKLRPSALKLFDTATCFLTTGSINHVQGENETVHFSLIDYARECNIDVDPLPCDSPDEAAKEISRAKANLREFKKEVTADLKALSKTRISWTNTDMRPGEPPDFVNISIFPKVGIKSGEIIVTFFSDIADYLFARNYIMQYPLSLRGIPNTNPNCYAIGRKLALHASLDANVMAGRADRISVKALLQAAPEIQSYDEMVASGNRNWKARIKKPLEDSLNLLVDYGVLTGWEYCGTKGTQLTTGEKETTSYPNYENFLVHFTMNNAPDQTERLKKKAEQAKKASRSKGKKTAKRKPKTTS